MTTTSVPTIPQQSFPQSTSFRTALAPRASRTTLAQILLLQAEDDDLPEFWD